MIEIKTRDGVEPLMEYENIAGILAVHKRVLDVKSTEEIYYDIWDVTHIPSGFSISMILGKLLTESDAKHFANYLLETIPALDQGWLFKKPEEIEQSFLIKLRDAVSLY